MEPSTAQPPDAEQAPVAASPPQQSLSNLAFRFCFIYFGLFIFFSQLLGAIIVLPIVELPEIDAILGFHRPMAWIAVHVFRVSQTMAFTDSGSGDKIYDWVKAFCWLVLAVVATSAWTVLDRRRPSYVGLSKWFRLIVRFTLSGTMITYGIMKAIPLQMPAPQLTRLVEPYGNFSPMGVLWYSIGAAPMYEVFAGCAELLAGLLLVLPRTATLGALVCLADSVQIFMLNMAYDVPVKLFSFHLILMSLFLLGPEASRLIDVFLLNRQPAPSTQPPLLKSQRGNRIAVVAQTAFGAYVFSLNLYGALMGYRMYGAGAAKSPLYGIWNVAEMSIDGQVRSPLLTDYDRWRRVFFQSPTNMAFQRMDDSFTYYGAKLDESGRVLNLTKKDDKSWKADWVVQRPSPEQLILAGELDGHRIKLQLELVDHHKFLLLSRGFHWTQEYPFNR